MQILSINCSADHTASYHTTPNHIYDTIPRYTGISGDYVLFIRNHCPTYLVVGSTSQVCWRAPNTYLTHIIYFTELAIQLQFTLQCNTKHASSLWSVLHKLKSNKNCHTSKQVSCTPMHMAPQHSSQHHMYHMYHRLYHNIPHHIARFHYPAIQCRALPDKLADELGSDLEMGK